MASLAGFLNWLTLLQPVQFAIAMKRLRIDPEDHDATPVESYVSLDESELRNLSVDIEATPGFADRERLLIQLPRACQGVKVDWELYWFAKDRPTTLRGYFYSQNGQLAWGAHDGFGDATAVSGWAKVVVPTDFTALKFSKKRNGSWQTKRVGSKSVKFRIDRNQITYKTGDLTLMAVDVFDATGRHLRTEYGSQGDGATSQRVWGQPDRDPAEVPVVPLVRIQMGSDA